MNLTQQIESLRGMTVGQLKKKYVEVFGEECRSFHKTFLYKRIAWRLQAQTEGDLSERARRRAGELANEADLRLKMPKECRFAEPPAPERTQTAKLEGGVDRRLPMTSNLLVREYQGRKIEVKVVAGGFEYGGKTYRSLSAVAKAVTGTHWNGYEFFGLRKKGRK